MSFDVDNLELAMMFEEEGMSYVLLHKIDLKYIADPTVREIAITARNSLWNLQETLGDKVSEEQKEEYREEWG